MSGPFLHRSWLNVPHVTHNDEADITELDRYRKELDTAAKAETDYRVTLLAFLVKACVSALKQFPEFNSSLSPEKDSLILKGYYNIGIAVDTPDGLVVPVVKDADRKGIIELSREFGAISAKARDGKLSPGDMQGGTFTISSLGGIGGTGFTPIVNAPEVAILGVVRSAMTPVWNGTEFVPRNMLPLSLSYDHRVIDGALAARFTRHLCHLLEDDRAAAARQTCGVSDAQEIQVPDIGDFTDVPVIEIHVAPGDTVAVDDPLVTLESDKATMDVPAPVAGTVAELRVAVGDQLSQGSVIMTMDAAGAPGTPPKERVHEGGHPQAQGPADYGSASGVYDRIEVTVPDIGDFDDVPVIEVHVAAGDTVAAEDPLITLESDKATMDVPAPAAGTVTAVKVGVGDTVSAGHPDPRPADRGAGTGAAGGRGARRAARRPRRAATSTPRCSCSGPGRVATPPPSGPPTWASRSCWWTAGARWAGSASTWAASRRRRCCTRPR